MSNFEFVQMLAAMDDIEFLLFAKDHGFVPNSLMQEKLSDFRSRVIDTLTSRRDEGGGMKKFLVCRLDALNPGSTLKHSNYWPMIVELPEPPDFVRLNEYDFEQIARKAFERINQSYIGMHDYIVVPLDSARVVSFTPRQDYDVTVRRF